MQFSLTESGEWSAKKITDDVAESVSDANETNRVEAEAEKDSARSRNKLCEDPNRWISGFERFGEQFRKI